MNHRIFSIALTTAVLLLGNNLSMAADTKPVAPATSTSQASSPQKNVKTKETVKPKAVPKAKLVDINSASAAELKKLPGISDAQAAKIIAGRPYGSKAWLVSSNIIDGEIYANIKDLIIAKQPFKDSAKNAAFYKAKK